MDGLNKEFTKDPEAFMRARPILEAQNLVQHPPAGGVVDMDFRPVVAPFPTNAVRIDSFAARGKAAGNWKHPSHRISAFWLPWQAGATVDCQLGPQADYFFTSQIAGCQIRIIPGPFRYGTNYPLVRHIAGDHAGGTVWRNAQAALGVPAARFALSRSLSSTALMPVPPLAPNPRAYRGDCVNVVGFVKRMRWRFWAQQVDGENLAILRVWEIV